MSRSAQNLYQQLPQGYQRNTDYGPVYKSAPAAADDLTLIRGIGTREAAVLNHLGVYFFPQVALWDQRAIRSFADELGMSSARLTEGQWVQQAQAICRPRPTVVPDSAHLPASAIRTTFLLMCAILFGCLIVFFLNKNNNRPLRGILSADITSIRVPNESLLVKSHVKAGDEVFSGDRLLTLEKTAHQTVIASQQREVELLMRNLQQAEARASLDLGWREMQLDRDLSEVRTRAHLIQQVKRPLPIIKPANQKSSHNVYRQISQSAKTQEEKTPTGSLLFITGSTEELPPLPRRFVRVASADPVITLPPKNPEAEGLLTVEARSVESRLQNLEQLKQQLPKQVRQAAGVESARIQYESAAAKLAAMEAQERKVEVRCPAYGRIGQVQFKEGDTMPTGEVMLKILHTDRRYVSLLVPTRRVTEIEPGTIVDLIFPAEQHYRGRVVNVPMIAESNADGSSLATVRVEPHGRLWPEIPIGSEIDVQIPK